MQRIIRAGRVQSKPEWIPVLSLLTGSLVWGLIWYPYRALGADGISGTIATLLTYLLPLLLGATAFRHQWKILCARPHMAIAIGLSAGWCNLAYVLSMLGGDVMQVLLLFYLAPLWTVLFAFAILREAPGIAGAGVIVTSAGGAAIMLWQPGGAVPIPERPAEWLALSSGITFALTNVLSRKAGDMDVRGKSLAIWCGVSLVACAVLLVSKDVGVPSISASNWLIICCLGVVIFAANLVVQEGVTRLGANQAIVILLIELVFAAIGAYVLAGERMSRNQWAGGALIVTATLLSGRLSQKKDLNNT